MDFYSSSFSTEDGGAPPEPPGVDEHEIVVHRRLATEIINEPFVPEAMGGDEILGGEMGTLY